MWFLGYILGTLWGAPGSPSQDLTDKSSLEQNSLSWVSYSNTYTIANLNSSLSSLLKPKIMVFLKIPSIPNLLRQKKNIESNELSFFK